MGFKKKTIRGQLQPEHLLKLVSAQGWLHTNGENQHIQIDKLNGAGCGVFHRNPQASVTCLLHRSRQPSDIVDSDSSALLVKIFKAFAEGPHIHIEDLDLHLRMVFLEYQGALDRIHAADVGAIRVSLSCRARSDALHKTDRTGLAAIARAHDPPL